MELPDKLKNVIQSLAALPGVGEKTATRQALAMTRWPSQDLMSMGRAIQHLSELKHCERCGMFAEDKLCEICLDPIRSQSPVLCIVESITDLMAIERSGNFLGKFHITFGVLNPLMGIGPDELHLNEFFIRIKNESISEIILAINPSVEGDATCNYIKMNIEQNVKVERIGFGIPMGGSLEYVDSQTIKKALENRRDL